jgi:hypothetical protein
MIRLATPLVLTFSCAVAMAAQPQKPAVPLMKVPLIGCIADGQTGPVKAPTSGVKLLAIPPHAAERLAWYQGPDDVGSMGVLGPRGWHCFEAYGSSGATLYLSPESLSADELIFRHDWKGFQGPAIQISIHYGDTSGRFEVAKVIARVFPAHLEFTRKVKAEGLAPASDFPTGAFPNDKLTYRNGETVEFETPSNMEGLGTMSGLLKNSEPIRGVAILTGQEANLLQLSVRLPTNSADIVHAIIQQTEQETAKHTQ